MLMRNCCGDRQPFQTVSRTAIPVTSSCTAGAALATGFGIGKRQRTVTDSQLCQTLRMLKVMLGWLPWPASKLAREAKVALPRAMGPLGQPPSMSSMTLSE